MSETTTTPTTDLRAELARIQAAIAAEDAVIAAKRECDLIRARRLVARLESAETTIRERLAQAREVVNTLAPTQVQAPKAKSGKTRESGAVFTVTVEGDTIRVVAGECDMSFDRIHALANPYATGREFAKTAWGSDAGWRGNTLAARLIRLREPTSAVA